MILTGLINPNCTQRVVDGETKRRQSRQTNFPIFLGIHGPRNRSSSKMTIRPRLRTRPDRVLGWDNLLMITNQGNVSTAFPLFLCQSVDQKLKFLVKFFQLFFEKNMKTNGGLSDSYPKIFCLKSLRNSKSMWKPPKIKLFYCKNFLIALIQTSIDFQIFIL